LPDSDISVGVELEFDKILVSIEEGKIFVSRNVMFQALGSATQDLAPLYQRKKDATGTFRTVHMVSALIDTETDCSLGLLWGKRCST
jgi:hypothetical protein